MTERVKFPAFFKYCDGPVRRFKNRSLLLMDMPDAYEKLLNRVLKNLPDKVKRSERFEIPKVRGHVQGQKTVLSNIHQISSAFTREPAHLTKFLLRELATPGSLKPKGLLLGRKISAVRVNEKIRKYAEIFVLCKECGKPDTKIVREDRVIFLKCTACGARHPVTGKI